MNADGSWRPLTMLTREEVEALSAPHPTGLWQRITGWFQARRDFFRGSVLGFWLGVIAVLALFDLWLWYGE